MARMATARLICHALYPTRAAAAIQSAGLPERGHRRPTANGFVAWASRPCREARSAAVRRSIRLLAWAGRPCYEKDSPFFVAWVENPGHKFAIGIVRKSSSHDLPALPIVRKRVSHDPPTTAIVRKFLSHDDRASPIVRNSFSHAVQTVSKRDHAVSIVRNPVLHDRHALRDARHRVSDGPPSLRRRRLRMIDAPRAVGVAGFLGRGRRAELAATRGPMNRAARDVADVGDDRFAGTIAGR